MTHQLSRPLRSGYTTGACAAAASKGATLILLHQTPIHEISIELPAGLSATFQLHGQTFNPDTATCFVIKDAGDDPDVTNGAEIHATVSISSHHSQSVLDEGVANILITGGIGIGHVTKPGLAVQPGEWAINPVPRRMIEQAVSSALPPVFSQFNTVNVAISIPDGEERSKKTLNARLGIIGGLSILGTTGIVRPVSAQAWTDTIDAALDVARACECTNVVLSTGRTSELAVQKKLNLPDEAFVMMGDHVAHSLRACRQRGFNNPIIACQFAKLLKMACGHENTHAAASELDMTQLLEWAQKGGVSESILEVISKANTAREIVLACSFDPGLIDLVFYQAKSAADRHSPDIQPIFMVADYSGNCISNCLVT
jgi:cobalt-precorrin-5B (C1)-methyltransferase